MYDLANVNDLIRISRELASRPESPAALVTVIQAEGSTFRRTGARMVVFEDGSSFGSVSGGCLEGSVIDSAVEVIESGSSVVLRYDGDRDDPLLGAGAMCDGAVAIGIEKVDSSLRGLIGEIGLGDQPVPVAVVSERDGIRTVPAERAGSSPVWISEIVGSPFTVFVCGAGALARAIAGLGDPLGWRIVVVDHREAMLQAFADVEVHTGNLVDLIREPGRSAVVVATHHLERDAQRVSEALGRGVPYVGLVGSRGRAPKVIDLIDDEARLRLDHLRTPAGLDIGSESVEEIALSIAAEIQASRTSSSGEALSVGPGRVHHRGSARIAGVILAAGRAERMGAQKLLIEVGEGGTMLDRAISAVGNAGVSDLIVVEGEDPTIGARARRLGARVVRNPEPRRGLSSSIRTAMASLSRDVEAVLISVADQPGIGSSELSDLIGQWRSGTSKVVATRYPEGGGTPAVFSRETFSALMSLEDDVGAKHYIRSLDGVDLVELGDTRDVDFPSDIESIRSGER